MPPASAPLPGLVRLSRERTEPRGTDGAARHKRHQTYPELVRARRCRLVACCRCRSRRSFWRRSSHHLAPLTRRAPGLRGAGGCDAQLGLLGGLACWHSLGGTPSPRRCWNSHLRGSSISPGARLSCTRSWPMWAAPCAWLDEALKSETALVSGVGEFP